MHQMILKEKKRNLLVIFFMARLLDESFFNAVGNISSSKVSFLWEYVIAHDNFVVVGIDLKDWKMKWSLKAFKRPFNLNYTNTKEILLLLFWFLC
jgi:hypothetical protein